MNLAQKISRSKSDERSDEKVDFTTVGCLRQHDPLVKIQSSKGLSVEPNWTIPGDFEGSLYADYILSHPEYDGIYVRHELLQRLEIAAESLSDQYELVVRAGHRPLDVQKWVLHECMEVFKQRNPWASDEAALVHARIFVSDPRIELPPHCTGAAVDIDVRDITTNTMVDFGSLVNDDNDANSYLNTTGITKEQAANRQMLLRAMLNAGFASTYAEWWHYSYGDQVWAWFYGKTDCLYDIVEL